MDRARKKARPFVAAAVLGAVALTLAGFLYVKWPFTGERFQESLAGATQSTVQFARFRPFFFPHPGGTADEVAFKRGQQTLASARKVTVVGSWGALLTLQHYVSRMDVDSLRLTLPANIPPAQPPTGKKKPEATIGELTADGAVLEIARSSPDAEPLTFKFARLHLQNVSKQKAINYTADLALPLLPARLLARGSLGPWQNHNTPAEGKFELQGGKLGAFPQIDGTLAANGKFKGILTKLNVAGHTDTPDFRVKRHRMGVETDYTATVNGLTGDVQLHAVEARFLSTVLQAQGAVRSIEPGAGKTVALTFLSDRARIQDLLRIVTVADRPALNGPMTLRASVELPPGEGQFLRKLRLDGDFAIRDANFTKPTTQTKVSELSARSRGREVGEDEPAPERALSSLKGHVEMRNGTAKLSKVSFSVPGATAQGGGVYDVIDKRINLAGKVAMAATVSEASSGWKSILLKPFNSLFKRRNAGAVLPVSVTGYYPRPRFQVTLREKERSLD